jgi:putative DNA primase/helicase
MRAAELHSRVGSGGWPALLPQFGIGESFLRIGKSGPCPACGGTDRFVFDNRKGHGDFFCRNERCGPGDGFDLIMRVHGWTFSEARREVMQAAGLEDEAGPRTASRPASTHSAASTRSYRPWRELAAHLWEQSEPLHGSLAETYLKQRGCRLPPEDADLRFLAPSGDYAPAMLARITDATTAEPISLHFTRLASDGRGKAGTDRDKHLLTGHRKTGGVVRLWPDESVTHGLAIAEGVETALCAAHAYTPVWAAVDAGNLAALPVLAGIETLVLVADHDPAGIKAAKQCAQRWTISGRQVRIALPRQSGEDAADVVAT